MGGGLHEAGPTAARAPAVTARATTRGERGTDAGERLAGRHPADAAVLDGVDGLERHETTGGQAQQRDGEGPVGRGGAEPRR